MQKKHDDGKISLVSLVQGEKRAAGYYDGDKVQIKRSLNTLQLRMNLGHEGKHAYDNEVLDVYRDMTPFERERRAYNVGDTIYNEITGRDYHTTDAEIRENINHVSR